MRHGPLTDVLERSGFVPSKGCVSNPTPVASRTFVARCRTVNRFRHFFRNSGGTVALFPRVNGSCSPMWRKLLIIERNVTAHVTVVTVMRQAFCCVLAVIQGHKFQSGDRRDGNHAIFSSAFGFTGLPVRLGGATPRS